MLKLICHIHVHSISLTESALLEEAINMVSSISNSKESPETVVECAAAGDYATHRSSLPRSTLLLLAGVVVVIGLLCAAVAVFAYSQVSMHLYIGRIRFAGNRIRWIIRLDRLGKTSQQTNSTILQLIRCEFNWPV